MKMYELLAKPENWTKNANARDAQGNDLGSCFNPRAVSFCLIGALCKTYGMGETSRKPDRLLCDRLGNLSAWNDAPARTHAEVLALLHELDI